MPELASEILLEIRRVLTDELEIAQPVELHHELRGDLLLDSMGAIVLAVALEDRFRVKLSDAEAADVVTVRDLVEMVGRKLREAPAVDGPGTRADEASS